jgi:hypothetical protein
VKKTTSLIASSALLAAMFTAAPAQAQLTCDDIDFTGPQSQRLTQAEMHAACLGVVERDGQNFAKFTAELQRIAGTTVYAKFKLADGSMSDTYKFDLPPEARVSVEGRQYRYRDLGQGAEINLYVPEGRWEVHVPESEDFATAATVAAATPVYHDESDDMVAALPKTASPLPLIGLMGGLLTSLGVLLYGIRRRFLKA